MMGSRGSPDPQVETLAATVELLALAKGGALPAAVANLRKAQAELVVETEKYENARADHDARQAKLDAFASELSGKNQDLADRETTLAEALESIKRREDAVAALRDEVIRRDAVCTRREHDVSAAEITQKAKHLAEDAARVATLNQGAADAEALRQKARTEAAKMLTDARAMMASEQRETGRKLEETRKTFNADLTERETELVRRERALEVARTAMKAAIA